MTSISSSSSMISTPFIVLDQNFEQNSSTSSSSPSSLAMIGKKRYDFFLDKTLDEEDLTENKFHHDNDIKHGLAFVGSVGQLDCSIGTIFQDDFRKSIDQLKEQENKNNALSVLIVDDSVIHRKLSQKVLGGMIDEVMWMVECAETGERAMQLVQTSPRRPDVIIIDQNMEPGGGLMLGHQVVELLRKDKAFSNVAIIGCTGMAEAKQDLLLAGCDAVWSKPMPSREEAQAQIVQILRNKKSNFNSNLLENDISGYPGFTNQQIYERDSRQEVKDLDIPVFRQVKMARISYKPIPSSASLLPFSRGSGFGNESFPSPSFNFGILPAPPKHKTLQDSEPDKDPLDITSMKRALADIPESRTSNSPPHSLSIAANE